MSVYNPLQEHLSGIPGARWKAKFSDIERILRRPLPRSAYAYQAWWANQQGKGHVQAASWRDAGWRTANLDLDRQTVEFERSDENQSRVVSPPATDMLLRKAAMYLGTRDETIVYREALSALVNQEARKRLAGRGGSSPQASTAPRRRGDTE